MDIFSTNAQPCLPPLLGNVVAQSRRKSRTVLRGPLTHQARPQDQLTLLTPSLFHYQGGQRDSLCWDLCLNDLQSQ